MTASQQGKLFFSFLRIGLLGFGGGPSMIPLVHQEVVKRHAWMKDEEFADVLAIANTLPGPIATKMPGYIGFRVGGTLGCINAVVAVILPMIVAMILLLGLFSRHRDVAWIHGMSQGMVPVVMVMMGQLAWDFLNKSRLALGWAVSLVMAAVAAVLIYWLGVHPGLVIGTLLVAAMLPPLTKRKSVEEAAQ
ncbi:chromate transporter [Billgrantia ethanolica]|uniref:Chromate transporter n=1 Tax=Billgrantia ethanolica TaxID=2733486 RepID=A0ABS9A779_9GAMM|nr:chromate transporter [Halomonas ethanolica]MCE8003915.1 chromate transporter [Halomonas ethanolica]